MTNEAIKEYYDEALTGWRRSMIALRTEVAKEVVDDVEQRCLKVIEAAYHYGVIVGTETITKGNTNAVGD